MSSRRTVRVVSDLEECRSIWDGAMPRDCLTDLWGVRACFQEHFRHRPHFIVAGNSHGIEGLLPLSRIEESGSYAFFPGETWQGKTWLEQNRIICDGNGGLKELLGACPPHYHVRYLSAGPGLGVEEQVEDETGYLFFPPRYGYDLANYLKEFSHKSAKNLLRELAAIGQRGVTYRYDDINDFDLMVELNIGRFGDKSYFHDSRFLESFRSLARFLREKGWLRVTAVLINGEPAAVDVGALYRGAYTLLAGGTNGNYPGVAKLINFHHLERACRERFEQVDFLCGDFNWKKLFHLTPRPLYLLTDLVPKSAQDEASSSPGRAEAAASVA